MASLDNQRNGILGSGWLPLAHLLRPQGRRGELLANPLSDLPELFCAGRSVQLVPPGASAPPDTDVPSLLLEDHWFPTGKNTGRVVLKLFGCDSISQAETLAGNDLLIAAADLPALDPGTFFVADLIGCILVDASSPGKPIPVGTIVDVEFATGADGRTRLKDAAPLLVVALFHPSKSHSDADEPALIPFVHVWLDSVDIAERRIAMRLPQGLFNPHDEPA